MNREEYIKLVEAKMKECCDVNNAPFPLTGEDARQYLSGKLVALQWALEMLPAKQEF